MEFRRAPDCDRPDGGYRCRSRGMKTDYTIPLLALLLFAATTPGACADNKLHTLEHLQAVSRQNGVVPRVFVKDDKARLYFTNDPSVMFEADWKRRRVSSQEFGYAGAMLECDRSPSVIPSGRTSWCEVKVLTGSESEHVIRTAAGILAPVEPNRATYFQ